MANLITASRILFSVVLLFLPALSPAFVAVYLLAGVSDMFDGLIARKTNAVSAFGAKLDTIADICFLTAAAYKLFPVVRIPVWLWRWAALIAVMKVGNIIAGFALNGEFPAAHTKANKATGLLLFAFPLTVPFMNPAYGAFPLCVMATFAAIREGESIRKRENSA